MVSISEPGLYCINSVLKYIESGMSNIFLQGKQVVVFKPSFFMITFQDFKEL